MPLYSPSAIAISPDGNHMYVCDRIDKAIYHITQGHISPFIGPALLRNPVGIAANDTNIYVLEFHSEVNRVLIQRIDRTTGIITELPLSEQLHSGYSSIVLSENGNLYVAGGGHKTISIITPDGRVLNDRLPHDRMTSEFYNISSMTLGNNTVYSLGPQKDLYFTDTAKGLILHYSIATYSTRTIAGVAGERGGRDGIGTAALFDAPSHIAYDPLNNDLYVTEPRLHRIRRLVIQADGTAHVTTIGGTSPGYVNAIGPDARFNEPLEIAVAGGIAYCADKNNVIRRIQISPDNTAAHVTTAIGRGATAALTFVGARTTPASVVIPSPAPIVPPSPPATSIVHSSPISLTLPIPRTFPIPRFPISPTSPRPVSAVRLPRTIENLLLSPPGRLVCAICQVEDNKANLLKIICTHRFHANCILGWVNSGGARSDDCPTCRGVIVRRETR